MVPLHGLVSMASVPHTIASRTRPLNRTAPMVLLLKHWKRRSSPGIVAGACARDHKSPFTLLLASGAGSHIRGLGYRANMAQRPASLAEAEDSVTLSSNHG